MTCRVITYHEVMTRWQPDARSRLERAATELFLEQGFAATTVPQIAARADLTTRTYFRHFADKREVLFNVENELPSVVAEVMANTPANLGPLDAIGHALTLVATTRLEGYRDHMGVRRSIIKSDSGLRERDLNKGAVLTAAARTAFLGRGLSDLDATVAAHTSTLVFNASVDRWLDDDSGRPLTAFLTETIASVRAISEP